MVVRTYINPNNVISVIDDRLYSSFIEHMGRAVYTGIYEPEHASSDEYGFRKDVMELIQPLNLSHIRYPGGNFLSGYNWMDGIGPKEKRPVRPDLAWFAIEPNEVGTDDFLQWCERLGVQAMMAVNLGTGTPQTAVNLLEYVNSDLPTYYASLRKENGHEKPYNVKLWCLGNEMDGPWQICGKTAEEYGRIACETAKMMKWLDPSIELIACGSSYKTMPTFGSWEETILRHCYEHIDYLSLHQYYQNNDDDIPSFLARNIEMDEFIKEVANIVKKIKKEKNSTKDIGLSFDEWNVWYHYAKNGTVPPKWTVARPIDEEQYDTADALLVGLMLNTLIRNTDTVKIACLAQLVNALAAIMTEPGGKAWAQTIYYPFLYASIYGRGISLKTYTDAPTYSCKINNSVPYLDCSAVLQKDGSIAIFAINRSPDEPVEYQIELNKPANARITKWFSLCNHAPNDINTSTDSHVKPQNFTDKLKENSLSVTLSPFSWNLLQITF